MSYWSANYVYDVAKTYVTVIIAIIALYGFNLDLEFGWLLLILAPWGLIAFTYFTYFFLNDENGAQSFTMLLHFFVGGLVPIAVTVLRLIKSTHNIGELLVWPFRILPSYNLCGGFVFISTKDSIASIQDESTPNTLSARVIGADVVMLILHPFIWLTLVALIERGVFSKCR